MEKAGRAELDRNPKREGIGGGEMSRVEKLVPKNEFARQRASGHKQRPETPGL